MVIWLISPLVKIMLNIIGMCVDVGNGFAFLRAKHIVAAKPIRQTTDID